VVYAVVLTFFQIDGEEFSVLATAIIIVNYCTAQLVMDCLNSIDSSCLKTHSNVVELIDNASPDNSVQEMREAILKKKWETWVSVVAARSNGGFAYGNNIGIRTAISRVTDLEYVLLLNPDTIVHPGAVERLVEFMDDNSQVGISGSRLEDPEGPSQHAARRFHGILNEFDLASRFGPISRLLRRWCIVMPESDEPHECDWLPGASLMIRREVFEKIGLLDEGFFMYFEEVDFCKRAKDAGFKVAYVPASRVVHLVGQASGVTTSGQPIKKRRPQYWFDSRSRYFLRHHGRLGLLAANMAWLLGHFIYHTTRILRGRPNEDPPYLVRDFFTHMLKPQNWRRPGPPIYPNFSSEHVSR
jgi:N-acetylglucosaminyl-diphospho-decaprenol L-rhamnosyltransferase